MGLDKLVEERTDVQSHNYRKYGSHEYNAILEDWINEFQSRFPEKVDIEFVEISSALKKNAGKMYYREGGEIYYIRIAEKIIDNYNDWYIRQVLLHTMVGAYLHQIGADEIGAGHAIKKWVCGRVGCMINAVDLDSEEWGLIAEPFLEENMKSNKPFL